MRMKSTISVRIIFLGTWSRCKEGRSMTTNGCGLCSSCTWGSRNRHVQYRWWSRRLHDNFYIVVVAKIRWRGLHLLHPVFATGALQCDFPLWRCIAEIDLEVFAAFISAMMSSMVIADVCSWRVVNPILPSR